MSTIPRDIRLSPANYLLARAPVDRDLVERPGPGTDCWGRRRRPLGTLAEELHYAAWGEPPVSRSDDWLASLIVTLDRPDAGAAVVATLRSAIEHLVRDIIDSTDRGVA